MKSGAPASAALERSATCSEAVWRLFAFLKLTCLLLLVGEISLPTLCAPSANLGCALRSGPFLARAPERLPA